MGLIMSMGRFWRVVIFYDDRSYVVVMLVVVFEGFKVYLMKFYFGKIICGKNGF